MRIRVFYVVVCALLFVLTGCSREPARGRVIVFGLDGADPHVIDALMAEGKMPNFARLRQEGAYAPLLSEAPLLSPVIWTTIATGKRPDQHRIGHFVAVNPQTGEQLPVTSQMRGVKALWNILSEHDRSVSVVGWWATWPAENVNGSIVSDHLAYHFLFDKGLTGDQDPTGKTYPAELLADITPLVTRPQDLTPEQLSRFIDTTGEATQFSFENPEEHFKWAVATAETNMAVGLDRWKKEKPDTMLLYVEGLDSASHLFGHLYRAEGLQGELAEQQRSYGRAVEQMYLYADELVGRLMAAMDDDTTLIVLSDHGFELGRLHDDPSKARDMRRVSEEFHRLRGIVYMYGHNVRKGAQLQRPSIIDIAPTVLALNGIPAAQDMPGRVLEEGLELVVAPRVASYETGATTKVAATEDPKVDAEVLKKLQSLGYLGVTSPTGDRSLAAVLFQQQRYDEAAMEYEKLVRNEPEDSALRASYAGALGALGRLDEALQQLDLAVKLDPLNAEAYHNRGVIYERKGEMPRAITEYQSAYRYRQFEPARAALVRLGAPLSPTEPKNEKEKRAQQLADQAAAATRRGAYDEATRLLAEAEGLAPDFVLIHQYKSNVAYLKGDRAGAIRALERALELEPGNALFKRNLESLKKEQ